MFTRSRRAKAKQASARIAELERWHARQDCAERGHRAPDGYEPDRTAVTEETYEVSGTMVEPIRTFGPTGPACLHCGDRLPPATDPALNA